MPTATPVPAHSTVVERSELVLGVLLAVLSGVAVAGQSRINGELGVRLGDGVLAAVVSFGGGLLLMLLLVPLVPRARAGVAKLRAALRDRSILLWQCVGGFGGATLVATQGLTVGQLGVALFVVAVVAGQTGSSLLVDRAGLGPSAARPYTWPRILGAGLTIVAVVWAMSGRIGGGVALWLIVLPLLAGCAIAVQQAINGRVHAAAGSALTTTLLNFVTGTSLLVVIWLVQAPFHAPVRGFPSEPWLYLGGPIGVVFIAIAALVVRWTGVLLFGLAAIAGQLVGAVLLDLLVPAPGVTLATATLVGTALTLVAVGVAALPGGAVRRPRVTSESRE
ncbi:MAG: DMT family transporter [Micromonosporaceae bacterium]